MFWTKSERIPRLRVGEANTPCRIRRGRGSFSNFLIQVLILCGKCLELFTKKSYEKSWTFRRICVKILLSWLGYLTISHAICSTRNCRSSWSCFFKALNRYFCLYLLITYCFSLVFLIVCLSVTVKSIKENHIFYRQSPSSPPLAPNSKKILISLKKKCFYNWLFFMYKSIFYARHITHFFP